MHFVSQHYIRVQYYSDCESRSSEGVNGIQLTHGSVQRWVMANIHKPSGFVKGEGFVTGQETTDFARNTALP